MGFLRVSCALALFLAAIAVMPGKASSGVAAPAHIGAPASDSDGVHDLRSAAGPLSLVVGLSRTTGVRAERASWRRLLWPLDEQPVLLPSAAASGRLTFQRALHAAMLDLYASHPSAIPPPLI